MSKWNKNRFTDHMMENCSREVAKSGMLSLILVRSMLMNYPGAVVMITGP